MELRFVGTLLGSPKLEREWLDALASSDDEQMGRRKDLKFYAHIPANLLKSKLDPAFWKQAFKFTTERHPYEKVVPKAYLP